MNEPNCDPSRQSQSFYTQSTQHLDTKSTQHTESKDALEKTKSAAISAGKIAGKTAARVLTGAALLTGSAISLLATGIIGSAGHATAAVISFKDQHKAITLRGSTNDMAKSTLEFSGILAAGGIYQAARGIITPIKAAMKTSEDKTQGQEKTTLKEWFMKDLNKSGELYNSLTKKPDEPE